MRCYTLTCILLLLCFTACQKELSNAGTPDLPSNKYNSLTDFFELNRAEKQSFTFKSNAGGTCQGKSGNKFYFSPQCFAGVLPDDAVTIEIQEILSPWEMILNNKPTMSNGKPLESGGEFNISASLKGNEIKLAPGKNIRIEVNGDFAGGMSVFNGAPGVNGTVNWTINTGQNNIVINRRDTLGGGVRPGYDLFCDSLKWINCDKFINEPLIKCSFSPVNCPAVDSTAVYVHLSGRNSVLRLNDVLNNVFYSNALMTAPATIVGICYKNKQFYAAIKSVNLSNNLVSSLEFIKISEDDLKKKLKGLK
jgi:hypothetical protein